MDQEARFAQEALEASCANDLHAVHVPEEYGGAGADVSEHYTVMAVTDPTKRSKGISAFVVEESDEGVSFGAPEKKLGIKGSPTYEVHLDNVRSPRTA